MTSLSLREPTSLLTDLVSGMQIVTNDPEIRIKEYVVGDQHVFRADLPGVDPDHDIDISVEGGRLRLRGQRREEDEGPRTEIRYRTFERALSLPVE